MTSQLRPAQEAKLKSLLRGRLRDLLAEVRQDLLTSDDDRAALLADRVRDVGDESLADLIIDLDLADIDRDLEELREVEAALARMSIGSYGTCTDCGEQIQFERLQASPDAKRCQSCQQSYERSYVQKGRPSL